MGKTGRTNKSYPEDLKVEAVRLVTEGNMAYREVAKRLGIQNKTQVEVWVKRHLNGQPFMQEALRKGKPKTKFDSVDRGIQEFRELAEKSAKLFSSRCQTITHYSAIADKAAVQIDYEAILSADLPNGLKKGDRFSLRGSLYLGFKKEKYH